MKMPIALVVRVLARIFARLLASLDFRRSPRSTPLPLPLQDRTDRLLGGHGAIRGTHHAAPHEAGGAS
jgi:hypothetical protein